MLRWQIPVQTLFQAGLAALGFGLSAGRCTQQPLSQGFALFYVAAQVLLLFTVSGKILLYYFVLDVFAHAQC